MRLLGGVSDLTPKASVLSTLDMVRSDSVLLSCDAVELFSLCPVLVVLLVLLIVPLS